MVGQPGEWPAGSANRDSLSELRVYLANHDVRARQTRNESINLGRVHRLDQINALKPANLFDSKSLTLKAAEQADWPV